MLGNGGLFVRNFSNGRNGLTTRVCGRLFVIVIMLSEKKSIWRFFDFAQVRRTASAESLVFPPSLQNHANIITKGDFP